MSGYTPVFASMYTGSLHGQWPAAAVWASLLPLFDARGRIDMSFQAIAAMTGWPMELLRQGIEQLEAPDPDSRCAAEDGRRLVRLEPDRPWGWRAVNHSRYRERAREKARSADGRNALKQRQHRDRQAQAVTRSNPLSPDETGLTLSDSDVDTDPDTINRTPASSVPGLDIEAWRRWEAYRREIGRPMTEASMEAAQRKLAGFGDSQQAVVKNSIAQGYTGLHPVKAGANTGAGEPVYQPKEFPS